MLAEFGEDFHEQHYPDCKYDVKFAFNRVCLKRAHQAIEAASNVLFRNFLFPDCIPKSSSEDLLSLDWEQVSVVHRIVLHQSPLPYLVEGLLSTLGEQLTTTGKVVEKAVLQLYRISSLNRILICAPSNRTCDVLMRSLQKGIPKSDIFRSNAAFRDLIDVPDDILSFCPYEEEEELFPCPPLPELEKFRVILSTFMSTFRLHNEGLRAGHFSHIFLVDASSAIEPEILVPLANLANEKTAVVVTGASGNRPRWVRSNIARQNGLLRSFFERLCKRELYMSLDPKVISQLDWSV